MTKYIIVVGGVISGVGKGVTTASIGKILQEYGYSTTAIKIDPYINYDAGTLRPTEHGEVWVTDDGGEIDQDLGNYERFLGIDIPKKNNLTTGQIYKTIIDKERQGKYLGKTVQFIPHVPEEVKHRIKRAARGYDFALIEIGGTIGDYENIPFLFSVKSLEREVGTENLSYILITYLPIPSHIEEMKTKPTQQAIRMLSENGIFPDFIVCRGKKPLDDIRKKKIETYVNIPSEHIISEPDIDTIYRIPLDLEEEDFGKKLLKEFRLQPKKQPSWKGWKNIVDNIRNPKKKVKIGMVCKYIDIGAFSLSDSYTSVNQALIHAAAYSNVGIEIEWVDAKSYEKDKSKLKELKKFDGIVVPGGFGSSGVEGKILAAGYAREHDIPYLGLCLGMQLAIVDFARNICKMEKANTTEVNPKTDYPVIDILPAQKKLMEENRYGATMRLGAYAAILKEKSQVLKLYEKSGRLKKDQERIKNLQSDKTQAFRIPDIDSKLVVLERHRHRFEVNPAFIDNIESKGLIFSGYHERHDGTKLMEFIEYPKNKFHVATQAHPEFKSRLEDPAPLFLGFIEAAKN